MKIILILLDGLGDRSYDVLDGRTPLEAAETPNMDRLAALGGNGMFHASFPGECLPSELAHFLMFGYDRNDFPGRGLLEAAGEKVPFEDADVLALAHFSRVRFENGIAVLEAGRDDIFGTKRDLEKLYQAVADYEADGIRFKLHQTRRNDGILVISGDVSPYISDSDPITRQMKIGRILPLENNPEPVRSKQTADALNKYLAYCHKRLCGNSKTIPKADFLVTQRCGRRVFLAPFAEVWGVSPVMIASSAVYGGLAHELGFDFIPVTDSNHPGRDLKQRIGRALGDMHHDFFHVHTKVPDEVSHKGTPILKKQAFEALDSGMTEIVNVIESRKDVVLVVTGDHSTPSDSSLVHSGESVPVVIAGPTVRRDRVSRFDEISAASGCLGLLRGRELMQMALNFADRSALVTHQLGDRVRCFIPEDYPPFHSDD